MSLRRHRIALSGTRVSVTFMLCFVLGNFMVSTEFSEGTDVDVEQNFVEMGDIELPDDDPVVWERILCYL